MARNSDNYKRIVPRSKNGTQKIKRKYEVQKKEGNIRRNPKMKKKKKIIQNKDKLINLEQIHTYTTRLSMYNIYIYIYTNK